MNDEWEIDETWRPQDGRDWVKILAIVRDNATGEVREVAHVGLMKHGKRQPDIWIWTDGNYSCDCNRAVFFASAVGEKDPDRTCGSGAFAVQLKNAKDGEIFYDEFDDK